jgi:hypothetical protein
MAKVPGPVLDAYVEQYSTASELGLRVLGLGFNV